MAKSAKRRVVLRAFQSFTLTMLDTFWFSEDTKNRIQHWVSFDPQVLQSLVPGAQVCVTAHMGNWEVLGMAVGLHGHRLVSVAAPLANRRLDHLFNELRRKTGQQILSKHGAVRGLMKALKADSKIALVLDQNTKPSAGGIFLEFFGLPVPMSSAVAMMALRTTTQVLVGVCIADRHGRYNVPEARLVPVPAAGKSHSEAQRELTVAISKELEQVVRRHPEHWLWMYKRWKYIAPGVPADHYPFYAKPLSDKELAILRGQSTDASPAG